jgi:hypothetical protein
MSSECEYCGLPTGYAHRPGCERPRKVDPFDNDETRAKIAALADATIPAEGADWLLLGTRRGTQLRPTDPWRLADGSDG